MHVYPASLLEARVPTACGGVGRSSVLGTSLRLLAPPPSLLLGPGLWQEREWSSPERMLSLCESVYWFESHPLSVRKCFSTYLNPFIPSKYRKSPTYKLQLANFHRYKLLGPRSGSQRLVPICESI